MERHDKWVGRLLILKKIRRPAEHDKLRCRDACNRNSFFDCKCGRSLPKHEEIAKKNARPSDQLRQAFHKC